MEWLQVSPNSPWSFAFMVWFFGLVAGYCIGRLHEAWINLNKTLDKVIK